MQRTVSVLLVLSLSAFTAAGCGGGSTGGGGGFALSASTATPTAIAGTPANDSAVVSWNAVEGATSYNVYHSPNNDLSRSQTTGRITGLSGTSTTITGLKNKTPTYVAVTSVINGAESELSASVLITPANPSFRVIASGPNVFSRLVNRNSAVSLTFNGALDKNSVTATNVKLTNDATKATIATILSFSASGNTLIATPQDQPLAASTAYTLTVAKAVKGTVVGTPNLALKGDFRFRFTTGTTTDTQAPSVKSTTPTSASTNVALGSSIVLTFSEDVDPPSATAAANFKLTDASNATIPLETVTLDESDTLRVKPVKSLTQATAYTLAVSNVKDLAGNTLANFTMSFTTGLPASTPASVTVNPAAVGVVAPASAPGTVTVAPTALAKIKTSFMYYKTTHASDNLTTILTNDINAYEAAGGSDRDPSVQLYVQIDALDSANAARFGPNALPTHFKVRKNSDKVKVDTTNQVRKPSGDLVSTDALFDFIKACNDDFKADRNILVLADHGAAYRGLNFDAAGQNITMRKLRDALQRAKDAGITFDAIIFDVCYMGNAEAISIMQPYANHIAAGQTTTMGMQWEAALNVFFQTPDMSTLDFLKILTNLTVAGFIRGGNANPNDWFVYDTSKVPAMTIAVTNLSNQLQTELNSGVLPALGFSALFNASITDNTGVAKKDICDLVRFCQNVVAAQFTSTTLTSLAQAVIPTVSACIVHRKTSVEMAKLSGLSISYGPGVSATVLSDVVMLLNDQLTLIRQALQAAAVATAAEAKVKAALANAASQPTISIDTISGGTSPPTEANPLSFEFELTNFQGAVTYDYIGTEIVVGSGRYVFLGVVNWEDEPKAENEFEWDGEILTVTDGTNTTFFPGFPSDFESDNLRVKARYTPQNGQPAVDVLIEVDSGTAEIGGVFSADGNGVANLEVNEGDTLQVYVSVYDEATDDITEQLDNTILKLGPTGLTVSYQRLTQGSYVYGVIVEDPQGNEDEVSTVVTFP